MMTYDQAREGTYLPLPQQPDKRRKVLRHLFDDTVCDSFYKTLVEINERLWLEAQKQVPSRRDGEVLIPICEVSQLFAAEDYILQPADIQYLKELFDEVI
jgi:hypothetical protein